MKYLIPSVLLFIFQAVTVQAAHIDPPDRPDRPDRPPSNRELLLEIRDELSSLRTDVDILKANDVACTVARRVRGECDQVFETKAEVCFELAFIKATGNVEWEAGIKAKAEGGLGWTNAPDGKIVADIRAPIGGVIPTALGIKISPELEGKGAICMEMPIEPRSLRAGNNVQPSSSPMLLASIDPPPMVGAGPVAVAMDDGALDTLAERLEQVADTIVPRLTDAAMEKMPSGERLGRALDATQSIMNGELVDGDGEFLSDQIVMDVLDVLPIPAPALDILQNPGQLRDKIPNLRDRDAVCEMAGRSALLGGIATDMCDFLNGLPKFDEIAGTIEGLPEAITAAVSELIDGDKVQQVTEGTKNKFCGRDFFSKFKFCD